MKKARMNISHFRFILFNLKIFGEIVTTYFFCIRNNIINISVKLLVLQLKDVAILLLRKLSDMAVQKMRFSLRIVGGDKR